jgi:hypothetical protein
MDETQNTSSASASQSGGKGMNPIVPVAIIGLIVIAAIGFFAFQGQSGQQQETTGPAMEQVTQAPTGAAQMDDTSEMTQEEPSVASDAAYKNGTYTAVGNYTSPGGAERIGVTVTIEDGVIVDSEVSTEYAERPNTVRFQGIFQENFEPLVVGKNIDEVQLDKVAASSLAPKGFNDALEQIKQEARV